MCLQPSHPAGSCWIVMRNGTTWQPQTSSTRQAWDRKDGGVLLSVKSSLVQVPDIQRQRHIGLDLDTSAGCCLPAYLGNGLGDTGVDIVALHGSAGPCRGFPYGGTAPFPMPMLALRQQWWGMLELIVARCSCFGSIWPLLWSEHDQNIQLQLANH